MTTSTIPDAITGACFTSLGQVCSRCGRVCRDPAICFRLGVSMHHVAPLVCRSPRRVLLHLHQLSTGSEPGMSTVTATLTNGTLIERDRSREKTVQPIMACLELLREAFEVDGRRRSVGHEVCPDRTFSC